MASTMPTPDPAEIEQTLHAAHLRAVELHPKDTVCRLIRLNTDDDNRLRQTSFPIKDDFAFAYATMRAYRDGDLTLNLAQVFVTLELLFGRTSNEYDDYKSSFAFPLFLHLQKSSGAYPYLLTIGDYKGSFEYRLRRIIDPKDRHTERDVYHEPLDDEFSRAEISYFLSYLQGFLEGYFKSAGKIATVDPFFRKIDARYCVYGYRDGEYFQEFYDTHEKYEAAVKRLEESDVSQPPAIG